MDLPTCPACGQSVLDDDVEDCPFCGASLSGEPAKKTQPKPAAGAAQESKPKPKAQAPKPSAAKAKAAKAKAEKAKAEDDDPFDLATTAAQKAIPLNRKPSKGRMVRLICPMCDTPGFTSKKAAGRDVRCANPKCLVPVFTAPKPDEPDEPEEVVEKPESAESPSSSTGLWAGIAVVGIAVLGVGVWYFGFWSDTGQPPSPQTAGPVAPGSATAAGDPAVSGSQVPEQGEKTDGGDSASKPAGVSLADLRSRSLKAMIVAAQQRDNNRSKPLCRRLAAEAHARAGDFTEAQHQLEQLSKVGESLPYYQVAPLVVIAWKKLEAGDRAAAEKTVEEAWSAAKNLPKHGQSALMVAVELATVLIAVDRETDAADLMKRYGNAGPFGQFAGLLAEVRDIRTYDLDGAVASRSVQDLTAPQRVAVTRGLVAYGHSDKARSWARSAPDLDARVECLAAWAEASTRVALAAKRPAESAVIASETEALPPTGKARVYARVAGARLAQADRTGAEEAVKTAREAMAALPEAVALKMPDMKGLYTIELPDEGPLRMAVLAHTEIAQVEARLKRTEEAARSLAAALEQARAMAPGPTAAQEPLDEIARAGSSGIRSQLSSTFDLSSNDEVNIALRRYRKQCEAVHDAAQARFAMQTDLLIRAVDWGLFDAIWSEIQQRAAETASVDQQEPYLNTALPAILAEACQSAGADELAQQIRSSLKSRKVAVAAGRGTLEVLAWKLSKATPSQAAANVNRIGGGEEFEKAWRWQWSMQFACRLVKAGNAAGAFEFIATLRDSVLREDTFRLAAALAARTGAGESAWLFVQAAKLPATEQAACYDGIVAGASAAMAEVTPKVGSAKE